MGENSFSEVGSSSDSDTDDPDEGSWDSDWDDSDDEESDDEDFDKSMGVEGLGGDDGDDDISEKEREILGELVMEQQVIESLDPTAEDDQETRTVLKKSMASLRAAEDTGGMDG